MYENVSEGDSIPIAYDSDNPGQSRPTLIEYDTNAMLIFTVLGGLILGIGLLMGCESPRTRGHLVG
jgi:hypothetical protein